MKVDEGVLSKSAIEQDELAALVEKAPHLGYHYESNPPLLEPEHCADMVACLPKPSIQRICAALTADPAHYAAGGSGRRAMAAVIEVNCLTLIREADVHAFETRRKADEAWHHANELWEHSDAAWRLCEEAYMRMKEAFERKDEGNVRVAEAQRYAREAQMLADGAEGWPASLQEAWRRAEAAEVRAAEAKKRADKALRFAHDSAKDIQEAIRHKREAERPAQKASARAEELWSDATEAQRHAEVVRARLQGILGRTQAIATSNDVMIAQGIEEWLRGVSDPMVGPDGTRF